MHPVLLNNPPISAYGVTMLAAILVGWWWTRQRGPSFGVAPRHIDTMAPLVVAAGLGGAWMMGQVFGEGRVLYGALICSVAAGIGYCVAQRLELGCMGDAIAPPLALGIGIGRVGCYLAGCCWGEPCGEAWWALHFPPGSFAYHQHIGLGWITEAAVQSLGVWPVQFMEAAGAAMIALVIVVWSRRWRGSGELFLAMSLCYAALRLILECFRADNSPLTGSGPTLSQWISLGIAPVCVATGLARRRRCPITHPSVVSQEK